MRKRLAECETVEEFKQFMIDRALEDFKFFKETRGEDEALKMLADYVYEQASNAASYFERKKS